MKNRFSIFLFANGRYLFDGFASAKMIFFTLSKNDKTPDENSIKKLSENAANLSKRIDRVYSNLSLSFHSPYIEPFFCVLYKLVQPSVENVGLTLFDLNGVYADSLV